MRTIPTTHYEAMFLLGQSAATDLVGSVNHIKETLTKYGAEVVALKKWADRPLAYPIKKQKRGMYILCYFAVATDKLGEIERAFNLSETVLRTLLVKADHLSIEEMKNVDAQLDLTIEANLRAAAAPPAPAPVTTGAAAAPAEPAAS
ncbi:MAG: 30S ribosomal protein S6 [Phycisphaerales bacterium]